MLLDFFLVFFTKNKSKKELANSNMKFKIVVFVLKVKKYTKIPKETIPICRWTWTVARSGTGTAF